MNTELTADRLRELLSYDAETGIFRWRMARGSSAKAGDAAGRRESLGYIQIGVDGRRYMAHRLAWLATHGEWPQGEIDHINGDRDDNRLTNLRQATRSQNLQNLRRARSDSRSGLLGASWDAASGAWKGQIQVEGKKKHLGLFDTAEAAHRAYLAAKAELHPFAPVLAAA